MRPVRGPPTGFPGLVPDLRTLPAMTFRDPSSLAAPLRPATGARAPRLRPVHRPIRFVTVRVVVALILREMTSTYGRRPGGYAWAILEPVAGIALLTWIFSYGFRHPALGTDFAIFYASGLMPFWLYSTVSGKVAQSLRYSRQLLAYPRVTVLDTLLARFILNVMLQLLIAYVVIAGTRMWHHTGTTLALPRILLGFTMAAVLAAGIGVLNCVLNSAWPVWASIWGIINRPLVLLSGVMFMIEGMPEPWRSWVMWNPLVHVVAETRSGFYYGYHPDYVFGLSLTLLAIGLLFIWRFYRELLEP